MPKVSIILPVYNGQRYVQKAIESVLIQSFYDWELLVLNDGSTDDTKKVVENFLKKDSRIIFIDQIKNLGLQKTLNMGIKISKGKFIARIDQDDEWIDKNKLIEQVKFLEDNPEYVLVGSGAVLYNENGEEIGNYHMPKTDEEIRSRILSKNCFLHPSILMRKDSIERVGFYSEKENAFCIEDYDLWLRLGTVGKLRNMDSLAIKMTVHSESITAKNRKKQASQIFRLIFSYKKKYPYFAIGIFVSLIRLVFFSVVSVLPLNKKFIYKLQVSYKNI